MDIQQIKTKQHFYYCLLIALLIEIKSGKIKNNKQKKRFLMGWINRAKRRNLFSIDVDDEISWLKRQLVLGRMENKTESLLKDIYDLSITVGMRTNIYHKACFINN